MANAVRALFAAQGEPATWRRSPSEPVASDSIIDVSESETELNESGDEHPLSDPVREDDATVPLALEERDRS